MFGRFERNIPPQKEFLYCPQGHENPCVWKNACVYCEKLCEQEKEDLRREDARRAAREKKAEQDSAWRQEEGEKE